MGLSLGECSALCFAGALDFVDGVKITKARGEAMQAASDAVDTGMVCIMGLDKETVAEICKVATERCGEGGGKIQIANYLCNGNYAVSGPGRE
jgi:[acyl-carrier-protein] S-malonyltransferase